MIKDWYKKWQVWLGVAVALLLILGCVFGFNVVNASNHRKATIEDFISLNEELYPNWYPKGSISWVDDGQVVEIERIQSDNDSSLFYHGGIEYVREDQMTADMLAFQLDCPVITYDRLSDGALYAVQVGYPDSESRNTEEEDNSIVWPKINAVINEARNDMANKQNGLLQELCNDLKADIGAAASKVEFDVDGDTVNVSVTLAPGYGFTKGTDSTEQFLKTLASEDSRILQKAVIFRYYSNDGSLLLEVESPSVKYYINPRYVQLSESEM